MPVTGSTPQVPPHRKVEQYEGRWWPLVRLADRKWHAFTRKLAIGEPRL